MMVTQKCKPNNPFSIQLDVRVNYHSNRKQTNAQSIELYIQILNKIFETINLIKLMLFNSVIWISFYNYYARRVFVGEWYVYVVIFRGMLFTNILDWGGYLHEGGHPLFHDHSFLPLHLFCFHCFVNLFFITNIKQGNNFCLVLGIYVFFMPLVIIFCEENIEKLICVYYRKFFSSVDSIWNTVQV